MSLLARLIDAGTPAELIEEVAMLLAEQRVLQQRRSADRERQQERRDRVKADASHVTSRDVTDVTDSTPPSRPPNDNNSNPPTHTPPENTPPARKADPFPRPDWADPQVWSDWMDVRRAKRARNTATAYAGFLRDVARHSSDEWPPGRLLEHAAARSWLSINRPNTETRHDRPTASNDQIQNPYARAVVARQAARAADERGQPDRWP